MLEGFVGKAGGGRGICILMGGLVATFHGTEVAKERLICGLD